MAPNATSARLSNVSSGSTEYESSHMVLLRPYVYSAPQPLTFSILTVCMLRAALLQVRILAVFARCRRYCTKCNVLH